MRGFSGDQRCTRFALDSGTYRVRTICDEQSSAYTMPSQFALVLAFISGIYLQYAGGVTSEFVEAFRTIGLTIAAIIALLKGRMGQVLIPWPQVVLVIVTGHYFWLASHGFGHVWSDVWTYLALVGAAVVLFRYAFLWVTHLVWEPFVATTVLAVALGVTGLYPEYGLQHGSPMLFLSAVVAVACWISVKLSSYMYETFRQQIPYD